MAVDFGILAQAPSIGRSFMAGREAAQAEQERNMLRQQQAEQMQFQRENMLAQREIQRENMLAQQEQRRAQAAALADAAARRNALAAYVRGGMPQGAAGLVEFGEEGFKAARALRDERMATLEEAQKVLGYATQRLAGVKSPESYAAVRAELGRLSPDFANAMPAEYDPAQLDVLVKQGLSLKDQLELAKPTVVAPGASVYQPGKGFVGTAPVAPEKPPADIATMTALGLPITPEGYARFAGMRKPEGTKVEVQLPPQERAFEAKLGSEQAEKLVKDKAAAEDARSIISTIEEGRRLLKSGVITGFGADFLTGLGAALNQAGINFAEDSVANTQAFTANMAANVGRIIKQFGAGTGLSNADREYAEKMAGGKVTLDRKSIERILDINERMARNVIALHNRNAAKVKTNIPLTVEEPPRAGAQAGGASVTLPDGRVMNFPNAEAAAAFKKAAGL